MDACFQYNHTVSPDEIDLQEHVHNLRYLKWTLAAAHAHSAACGWDSRRAQDERGIGWVVRSHEITYRTAALAGDELVIQTWLSEITPIAIRRRYVITRPADRQILAKAETRWVLVDLRNRKAIRLDKQTLANLRSLPSPPPLPWQTD